MIQNDEQREITAECIRWFEEEIDDLRFKIAQGEESPMLGIYLEGMVSQVETLYDEIAAYDASVAERKTR